MTGSAVESQFGGGHDADGDAGVAEDGLDDFPM